MVMDRYCFVFAVSENDKANPPLYIKDLIKDGHKVILLSTNQTCSPFNLYIRMKIRLGLSINSYLKRKKDRFGKRILILAKKNDADAICDVGGFRLNESTVDVANRNYTTFLILKDRLVFYKSLERLASHYDTVYSYSDEDVTKLNSIGIRSICVHSKGKDKEFYKLKCKKKYDVSFVGKMYPEKDYGHRYKLFKKLAYDLPDIKLFVGGQCAPLRRPKRFLERLKSKRMREVFCNSNLSIAQCNRVYNSSKICINIEREGTGNTWSGRITNLLHAGSFVLASENKILRDKFSDCLITFSSYEDLKKKIIYYLEHEDEREKIAVRGLSIIDSIIDDINKVSLSNDMCERLNEKKSNTHE